MAHVTEIIRQRLGEVVENPLRLDLTAARQICDWLNRHLGSEYVLYHQYKKHHWVVAGPDFRDLHKLFDKHAEAVREMADEIAERITYLGGVPVSGPAQLEQHAYVKPEPEGILDLRRMVENDLAINQEIIVHVRQNIGQCEQLGDPGTAHQLREWLVVHEKLAHELQMLLEKVSLTKGW